MNCGPMDNNSSGVEGEGGLVFGNNGRNSYLKDGQWTPRGEQQTLNE